MSKSKKSTATETEVSIDQGRQHAIEQLYTAHYAALKDACYAEYPQLLVSDCGNIVRALAGKLTEYTGPAEEEPFTAWASAIVVEAARSLKITFGILQKYDILLRDAIRKSLWTSAREYHKDVDDVLCEMTPLILKEAISLDTGGTAKQSTRLVALVKKHCWLYHNAPSTRHRKSLAKRLSHGWVMPLEHLSELELASMRAEEEQPWDAGYREFKICA